jgi:YidC/Oxa1 family membrane protein insertase
MSISAAFGAVVGTAHSAIEGLATLLTPVAGDVAGALAIVVFTLLIRLLISPLTYVQVRGERRRAALAPQIDKLRTKHRDDPMTLAAETMALQRAAGAGPFVSLLPGLAQAPFFMIMYRVALDGPAGSLFGIPLTAHLAAGLPVFAVMLALATALAWWSSRRMLAAGAAAPRPGPSAEPTAQALARLPKLLALMPYLTVGMVAYLPLAGGLYLLTSTAWTALEHAAWRRPVITVNR